jgi:hypothetical protein
VHIVTPQKVVGDDALRRMHDGNDALESEGLVALCVENRRERVREHAR